MDVNALIGCSALIVDDEDFFLSSVVEGLGLVAPEFEVLTARDGIEALLLLSNNEVDVLVTDIQMPRLDGFGLIAELDARRVDVPVVVMTAFEPPRARPLLPQVVEFLEKPIDFEQLLATLNSILRQRSYCTSPPSFPVTSTQTTKPQANKDSMMNVQQSLNNLFDINGSLGAALVDYESGMTLGTVGAGIDLEVAAAGNMEVMRAKQRVMRELGIRGGIEDILITLDDQYHLIRPVGEALFFYLALGRKDSNLAMARRKLSNVAGDLRVN